MLLDGFVVRPARAVDADQLADLEAEARAPLADSRGGPMWLEEHPPVEDWQSVITGDGCVTVAEIDGVLVGFLQMAAPDDRGVAAVVQVFVLPDARELGFGDILLAESIEWARSVGAVALEGEALPGDRDTKNLYERAGITARKIITYSRLDP
jgi:GNAT superfamily N-acetyltransferase